MQRTPCHTSMSRSDICFLALAMCALHEGAVKAGEQFMQSSNETILTTHVGSLPRTQALVELLIQREEGGGVEDEQLGGLVHAAVEHVVTQQCAAGVHIVNDGEQGRAGFQTYVTERMKGFGGHSSRLRPLDMKKFPLFAAQLARRFPHRSKVSNAPQAVADIMYGDVTAVANDCATLISGLRKSERDATCAFMTSASPGIIATTMLNAHYSSHEAYVLAIAREIRKEYEFIAAEGFILQLDAPDLAMERTMLYQDRSTREFLDMVALHVEALNQATDGIPRQKIRLHCCWGNWDGPHVDDVPLRELLPLLYEARVGGLSIEFANPRHQHEYAAFRDAPLPPEFVLLPGVIDSTTNYVEHPEVVANRICEAVAAVGDRERVVASTDCGFGTFAGYEYVAEDVVWAKLKTCRQGADIAARRLWGRD
jgi:5-methyltetrahydropteroyltriglutamate--homocysteine methyltransferase